MVKFYRSLNGVEKGIYIFLVFAALFCFAQAIRAALPEGDERQFSCNAEDEVLLNVREDSYNYNEGDVVCVHIDAIQVAR